MTDATRHQINILGVPVDDITMEQTVTQVGKWLEADVVSLRQVCTVNPEFVMGARQDSDFKQVLYKADLCIPDGIGLIVASRWLRDPLPERVAGSELVYHLAEVCDQKGKSLFLLGAAPGVAAEAAVILQQKFPALTIAGTYSGSPTAAENDDIVQRINASKADLLYVAFGAPNQDKWIARNRLNLDSVKVALGVGGSLDFITGRAIRAPLWMQRMGLEWLHRLIQEPWRWRRMLALPQFAIRVLFGLK
ncbi:MAG: WecB/TagA/CpsF family glycosyltransferase [Chloroflexota bacterium]